MALMQVSFLSKTIGFHTNVNIILPFEERRGNDGNLNLEEKFPVLYLLHGGCGNADDWCRFTSIERYAVRYKMAVVMPEVGGSSFYTDMVNGYDYYTFISEELVSLVEGYFPMIGGSREKRYVAGFSMGGYGALKWGLQKPDYFTAIANMSGASLIGEIFGKSGIASTDRNDTGSPINLNWGSLDQLIGSADDTKYLLDKAAENINKQPAIYVCIATGDTTYEFTQNFIKYAEMIGLPITYEEGPGGHDMDFWDSYLPRSMEWMIKL